MLRLLSADLVLDEVDDYNHEDMPAISRLVHLAGMLGRKVMISSATIAPAIAEGLFEAYQEGWRQFARFRNRSPWITSFWVDEFSAVPFRISSESDFKESHLNFINQRVRTLERTSNLRLNCMIDMASYIRKAVKGYQSALFELQM
jgi:CRISPR-associated endonuclease/helicase Cas3